MWGDNDIYWRHKREEQKMSFTPSENPQIIRKETKMIMKITYAIQSAKEDGHKIAFLSKPADDGHKSIDIIYCPKCRETYAFVWFIEDKVIATRTNFVLKNYPICPYKLKKKEHWYQFWRS